MRLRRPILAPTAALALLLASPLAPLLAQSPGAPDPTYGGGDGVRIYEPNLSPDANVSVFAAAAAADGRLWVAGSVLDGDYDTFACRVSTSGGSHSCLMLPFDLGGVGHDFGKAVAVGLDGRAVVAGEADGPAADPDTRAVFLRLTTGMALDPTFDGDGKIDDFNFSVPFGAAAVAVQADDKVVWAGHIDQSLLGVPNRNFLVGRLLANGALDPTFDGNGYRVILFDAGSDLADEASAIALQPDGKIVVVGEAKTGAANSGSGDYAIARLAADGSLDATFSGDGKVLVSFAADNQPNDSAAAVAVDRFGRIVVAGKTGGSAVGVVRLLPDGALDPSFGVGGKTSFSIVASGDVRGHRSLLLLPGDGILVAGDFDPPGSDLKDNYVAVLEPDGDLDPTFGGGDGKVTFATLPLIADPDTSFTTTALFAGKVLVAGDTGFTQDDIGFALRLWMSQLLRDDFETGNLVQWSGSAGS